MTLYSQALTDSGLDADQNGATVNVTGTSLNCHNTDRYIGLTFPSCNIPQGSTIDAATLDVYMVTTAYDTPDLTIYAYDYDRGWSFTASDYNISNLTPTTATVSWSASNIGSGWKTSPELKTIIQELVDRAGWEAVSATIVINGASSGSAFRIYSYDYSDGSRAAVLNVTYTAPAGGGGQPTRSLHQFRQRNT